MFSIENDLVATQTVDLVKKLLHSYRKAGKHFRHHKKLRLV